MTLDLLITLTIFHLEVLVQLFQDISEKTMYSSLPICLEIIIYNGEEVITISNKNLGNRFIHGFSIDGFSKIMSNLKLNYGLTYTKGDNNETYGPLPSISPLFGSIAISYSKRGLNLRAVYNLRFRPN